MDQNSILQHPHSRFIASTNYTQHYVSLYENEIVSKKKEFDDFFKRYKGIKEDEKAFGELCKTMKDYKTFYKTEISSKSKSKIELQLNTDKFADINEKRGIMTGNYDFLKSALESVHNHTESTNNYIKNAFSSIKKQKESINEKLNANSEPFSLEKLIKDLADKGKDIMDKVSQTEDDKQQELLEDAYKQILKAKIEANSEISNY